MLSDTERDALIERVLAAWPTYSFIADGPGEINNAQRERRVALFNAALAAIEEQYVLIPRDQVTVESEYRVVDKDDGEVGYPGTYHEDFLADIACCDRDEPTLAPHRVQQRTVLTTVTDWKEHDDPTR